MRAAIQAQLSAFFPPALVQELLDAHAEAKRNFYLGGLRLSEVEGGRFCEAAFRMLEHATAGAHTPLGMRLGTDRLIGQLAQIPAGSAPESIRLHIPRALRIVYDIRNKRDVAHLADGIDPNLQDATIVIAVLDWILAELIRLYHGVSPNDATVMVEMIVARNAPVVQEFQGFPKVLRPGLPAGDVVLILLYQRGSKGATLLELLEWVRPSMRGNLRRTLDRLVDERAFAHSSGTRYYITRTGERSVEERKLLDP
ncbi:MAG: hypothetical protein ABSE21_14045 [Bryobacteraceae bacterium]